MQINPSHVNVSVVSVNDKSKWLSGNLVAIKYNIRVFTR